MFDSGLRKVINYEKAYRKNRLDGAHWVLAHPETLRELLTYIFKDSTALSHKAAWVLEFVFLEKPESLYSHLDFFFQHLASVEKDQILRPCANICEKLAITYYKKKDVLLMGHFTANHKDVMTECSFDWLISDQKIACQARAMTALFFLGTEFDWIHSELKQIIERNIHDGSAGYKARGRSIITQIESFQKH